MSQAATHNCFASIVPIVKMRKRKETVCNIIGHTVYFLLYSRIFATLGHHNVKIVNTHV